MGMGQKYIEGELEVAQETPEEQGWCDGGPSATDAAGHSCQPVLCDNTKWMGGALQ